MKTSKGWLLAVLPAVSTWMGCAHVPQGYRPPGSTEDGVRVVAAEEALKTGLPGWTLSMPLGEEKDASVLAFLERAEAAGARYVTDLDVVYAAEAQGQPVECRTHIQPVVTVEPVTVTVLQMPQSRVYTADETRCRVNESGQNQCGQIPVAREGQANRGLPNTLPVSSRRQQSTWRRQWRLQKSVPECTPREESGSPLVQRVQGRAYGCGDSTSAPVCEDKAL
jgi:hypothetical protein